MDSGGGGGAARSSPHHHNKHHKRNNNSRNNDSRQNQDRQHHNKRRKQHHDGSSHHSPTHGDQHQQQQQQQPNGPPRTYTVSIAVPGSIVLNAQSPELRTYLVGEVARAAAVFQVDEIVIFGDASGGGSSYNWGDPNLFMARLLQYAETPQYLRKAIFPHHPDLRLAGILNPLDAPHHPRLNEKLPYREGVTLENKGSGSNGSTGSLVNVGLRQEIRLDRALKPGVRVTVKLSPKQDTGVAVSPAAPRETLGLYWGYTTRLAKNLTEVLSGCPFKGGYDLTVGTSERGNQTIDDADFGLAPFQHLLIVFGGVAGLEACVEAAEDLSIPGSETHTLFDVWLNVCPDQGSRTIRTEEAVPITMARLRPFIMKSGKVKPTPATAAASSKQEK